MTEINNLLQRLQSPFLTSFFNLITLLGSTIGIAIFYFIILIFYNVKKSKLYLVTILSFFIIIQVLKIILNVPRPFNFKNIYNLDYEITGSLNPNHSTPSGHSYVISYSIFFIIFNFKINKLKSSFYYTLLILTIISRLYLGVHSILDVALGSSLGFLFCYILHYYNLFEKIKINYLSYILSILAILAFFTFIKRSFIKNNLILIVVIILSFMFDKEDNKTRVNIRYFEKIKLTFISIIYSIIFFKNPKYDFHLLNIIPIVIINYLIYINFDIFYKLKNDIININKRRQIKWKN